MTDAHWAEAWRDAESAARRLFTLLAERKEHLVLAESCTGGLAAALFTEQPGASQVLWASLVTYTEDAKERLLGVARQDIETYGVVSLEVALAMARGAIAESRAELAVAITGFAGPLAALGEAAPGRVCFGFVGKRHGAPPAKQQDTHAALSEQTAQRRFEGDRSMIRLRAVTWAFDEAVRFIEGL